VLYTPLQHIIYTNVWGTNLAMPRMSTKVQGLLHDLTIIKIIGHGSHTKGKTHTEGIGKGKET
jgi:hypothetical protein